MDFSSLFRVVKILTTRNITQNLIVFTVTRMGLKKDKNILRNIKIISYTNTQFKK